MSDVAWYEHVITHYESQIDSEHKTKEEYNTVVEERDSYRLGKKISAEEFTRKANEKNTEVEVSTKKKRLTGATEATMNQHVETAYVTTIKVIPSE